METAKADSECRVPDSRLWDGRNKERWGIIIIIKGASGRSLTKPSKELWYISSKDTNFWPRNSPRFDGTCYDVMDYFLFRNRVGSYKFNARELVGASTLDDDLVDMITLDCSWVDDPSQPSYVISPPIHYCNTFAPTMTLCNIQMSEPHSPANRLSALHASRSEAVDVVERWPHLTSPTQVRSHHRHNPLESPFLLPYPLPLYSPGHRSGLGSKYTVFFVLMWVSHLPPKKQRLSS